MEVVTREYKVYNFSELSEDAKEKAKQWYLDDDFSVTDLMNCHRFAYMNCHQIDWFSFISQPHRAAA